MVAFGLLAAGAAHAYPDGGPPAHTGGFGEPDCHACHFDGAPPTEGGGLRIAGLPGHFVPGHEYALVVEFGETDGVAGFQLSARDDAGGQAGELAPGDDSVRLLEESGIRYLAHADAHAGDTRRWRFRWRAPHDTDTVRFHVAANAANGDRSEFGDRIFVFEALTAMERRR